MARMVPRTRLPQNVVARLSQLHDVWCFVSAPSLDDALRRISAALDRPQPGTRFVDGKPRATVRSDDLVVVLEELNRLARLSVLTEK
jgi:hypothetical protein